MKIWLTCFFVMGLGAGNLHAAPATQPDPVSAAPRAIDARLDRILPDVKFDGVGFADALDFLRDISGINLFVDWKHLEQAKVDRNAPMNVSVKNQKFIDVLQTLLDLAGGKGKILYQVQGEVVIISTKEGEAILADALKADAALWDEKTKTRLARLVPEIKFDAVSLTDCVDFLHDVSGAKIDVDWDGFQKEGMKRDAPVTMKLRNIPFGEAVRLIFLSATDKPIEITATDQGIHIGPAAKAAKAADDSRGK